MTSPGRHSREPAERGAEQRDVYGFGPDARISVGGYFPRLTLVDWREEEAPAPASAAGGPLYAVAFLTPCLIRHAVLWEVATPNAVVAAACAVQARVAEISGVPVIWSRFDPMACEDCAVVVLGEGEQGGRP
ncbi:hypothetical protein DQ384_06295 [Sphaerisporangium album]|uniref:Uncharacterized protein n=1 Tax=Sphaerisporangium album TaxID=509200 RepID=A0A367FR01_9ACTN|nr:hypothetical protein [Sphaerisporangium album]RCG32120.1 hypothetical protein DQ384_06295 [Sphaerisporangium album]